MKSKIKKEPKDLADSKNDKKHLMQDESTLDLPEVKDIPGQEHIRPMPPGEMADTTISSADEEANDILDTDEDIIMQNDNSNVTKEERELLEQSSISTGSPDDQKLQEIKLDETDGDGTPLNEQTQQSGKDLDIPGSELDDEGEEIGEEDEENNSYSLHNEKEDRNNTKQ